MLPPLRLTKVSFFPMLYGYPNEGLILPAVVVTLLEADLVLTTASLLDVLIFLVF